MKATAAARADTLPADREPRVTALPLRSRLFAKLTVRERVLTAFILLCLVLVPAAIPQSSLDAQQFIPSNAGLQPIERAEDNFSGSAFYFIDPDYAVPRNYGSLGIDPLATPGAGQADGRPDLAISDREHRLQPVAFRGSSTDDSRALYCLTQAIYYEAGVEPDAGQRGVAQVILNRVRHPSYPGTVCGVVYQGSERSTGCQFTYTCDGSLSRKPTRFHWDRARKVAAEALAGTGFSTVGTATHYHASYVYPYWAPSLRFVGTVGAHRFYAWKGAAGAASAFRQPYRGGEPLPVPNKRRAGAVRDAGASAALDPIALEKAYEAGRRKAEAAQSEAMTALAADNARRHQRTMPSSDGNAPRSFQPPQYSVEAQARGGDDAFAGRNLPDNSQIKAEFRSSGSWKKTPGS